MKQLKEFILEFEFGYKEITRHYDINEVIQLYLNRYVRTKKGLKICIKIYENEHKG